ncbi:MAG: hypothetical protein IH956_04255 [Chloroflexi bacterium]|nr:hypothetical protein [Chloroflexota bacterium]
MSTPATPEVAVGSGPPGEGDGSLLLAESTPIGDLPGLLRKKAVIGAEQVGYVTVNGNVDSELGTGASNVGWSVLGFAFGKKEVLRLHNRSFRLLLHFSNLLSKGYETLEAVIHTTVSVSEPSLFFRTVVRGRDRLSSSELGSIIAAGVDDIVQIKVTENEGQSLRHDKEALDRLTSELQPHLSSVLGERGLRLESVDLVAFHNPEEANQLLDELSEVERLIKGGTKPGREDVQSLLTRLTNSGLATGEMAERAQLVFDGGTDQAFFNYMKDIATASRRRLEAQVVDRSEKLSRKLSDEAYAPERRSASFTEKALKTAGPLATVVGVAYKLIPSVAASWIVLVVGVALGLLSWVFFLVFKIKRLGGGKGDEIVIRLDKWAKKNSMSTDELIRRQMGRELSNTLTDITDAKLTAFKQEKKDVAEALSGLENRTDLLRTEVESAPRASTIVSAKGFPTQRISRMVSFEEEMLRHARNLSIRAQTAKASLDTEDVDALATGLDNFQRTFSKRLGFLEGFKEL